MIAGLQELRLELFLRMRNNSQILWRTVNGNTIPINKMTDAHLINSINMLEREEDEEFWTINSDLVGLDNNDIC